MAAYMFKNFHDLVDTWKGNNDPALEWREENDASRNSYEKKSITYDELFREVQDETKRCLRSNYSCELIKCAHKKEVVVRIFADVLAGNTIVLSDELSSVEKLRHEAVETSADALFSAGGTQSEELKNAVFASMPVRRSDYPAPSDGCEGDLIFFTSGTSAQGKAVVLSSSALCSAAWSGQSVLPCGPTDTLLSIIPLSHVFGFVCSLLWGLAYGACVALGGGRRHIYDDCKFFQPTILPIVPAVIFHLLKASALNDELKCVLIGAAAPDGQLIQDLRDRHIDVRLGYGLTETGSGVALSQTQGDPFVLEICPGNQVQISDNGEVKVKSLSLMRGYIKKMTHGLKINPHVDAQGWFYTGDLGTIDEQGFLHIVGRMSDVLVLPDGTKIPCSQYERILSEMLKSNEVAVIKQNGHGVLVVGLGVDIDQANQALRQFNRNRERSQQLYKVVEYGSKLPRSSTGKLQRWAICI